MAFLNIFKKRKKQERIESKKPAFKKKAIQKPLKPKEPEKPKEKLPDKALPKEKTEEQLSVSRRAKPQKKYQPGSVFILKAPQITEKATWLQDKGQYIFKVSADAGKAEIKKSVEAVYNVDVLKVRILNVPRKRKRLGKSAGWRKGYKKAIVKLKKEQSIEILPH